MAAPRNRRYILVGTAPQAEPFTPHTSGRAPVFTRLFRLSFEFGVPDVLFERELAHWDGPALAPLGLKVLCRTPTG
jgi:hypothetical protein